MEAISITPEGIYSKYAIKKIAEYYNMSEEEVLEYMRQPRFYKLISFIKDVEPGQWLEPSDTAREVYFHGTIEKIFVCFPQGTNGKVDLRVWVANKPIFPEEGYLSLNGFMGWFDINYPVKKYEHIAVEIKNRGENKHRITVFVLVSNKLLYIP